MPIYASLRCQELNSATEVDVERAEGSGPVTWVLRSSHLDLGNAYSEVSLNKAALVCFHAS
jgi:hypothetical protein